MGVYSEIDLKEINEILKYYELGNAVSFKATITGISNSNFKVTLSNGKEVLLKVSNDKTLEQLENEQRILEVLENYNYLHSIHPFKTIKGKPIYHHKNFFGVVFPFINGLPPKIDKFTIQQIGKALAELHSLEIHKEDLASIRRHDLVGYGGLSIQDFVQSEECPKDFKEAFDTVFPDGVSAIPYDIFPAGIIHGDLYFDNSLFHEGKLVTLIDFEQSGRGRFILDLGIAISGSCMNQDHSQIDLELVENFLKGYEQSRHLLAIEKEYLVVAVKVGFFSIALWRIKRFYAGNLDQSKKFNYRELTERCLRFHAMKSNDDQF